MTDSLKHMFEYNYMDQVTTFEPDSSFVKAQDTISFIASTTNIEINPELIVNPNTYLTTVVLLVLLFFIASIWYFAPDVLVSNFKSITTNHFRRNWDSAGNKSGLIVNTLLYLNFFVVSSLLIFMIINNVFPNLLIVKIEWSSFYLIVLSVIFLIVLRYISIMASGFIFKTIELAVEQNRLYNSMEKGLGLILLPLLLFSIYTQSNIFLYLSTMVFLLFVISRWVFTIAIGIRVSKFSWFHIILYLCTLEIIPLLLLLKTLENQVFEVL